MKISAWTACFLGLACTASVAAEPVQIRVGGGGAACKTVFTPVAKGFEDATGVQLSINPTTPGQGLIELNNDDIDLAASAHPLEWMVRMAARSGVKINANLFKVRLIGTNRTLIFTHKTNKVKKLSKKQLQDIFTGRITNWKRVGGADMPIVVVWGLATPGQNELFTKLILDGEPILKNHEERQNYKNICDFIARTPGGIGINPEGFVTSSTHNPQIPDIISPVIAVTKGPPSPKVERLLTYIKQHKRQVR